MVVSSLSGGGAERVLVLLAKGLAAIGRRVAVVTIFGKEHDFYRLPDDIDRVALGLGKTTATTLQKITANLKRLAALRRAVRAAQPEIVLSFMTETNVLVLLATLGLGVPVIVTEHMDPRKQRPARPWGLLRRICYGRAARVVSVSEGVDAYFTWLPEARRAVIPNPVDAAELDSSSGEPLAFPWAHTAAAMGRLEVEKGFDLLIQAFARLAADFPDWGLVILGEGSQRDKLESLVARLDLAGRVRLAGALPDPFATLKQAELFVLPSRHEGFGNALVEAMACGVPVVAADCWHASPEIVRHDVDGVLVPPEDAGALAAAMADLMADPQKRRRLASRARESVRRFDLERISQSWDALIQAVAAGQ
jgi:GalNAc-alpha-(1->4)-GalNAc-alpha-(1->3)-diNAcBac-PP-undecaprenol alpha-1,4-N-acetyl-D-galactosaminyltransferase